MEINTNGYRIGSTQKDWIEAIERYFTQGKIKKVPGDGSMWDYSWYKTLFSPVDTSKIK